MWPLLLVHVVCFPTFQVKAQCSLAWCITLPIQQVASNYKTNQLKLEKKDDRDLAQLSSGKEVLDVGSNEWVFASPKQLTKRLALNTSQIRSRGFLATRIASTNARLPNLSSNANTSSLPITKLPRFARHDITTSDGRPIVLSVRHLHSGPCSVITRTRHLPLFSID